MYVYSYSEFSQGARAIASAIGGKRIRHTESTFVGNPKKIVINWGSSSVSNEVEKCRVINHPTGINEVSDKIEFFKWATNNTIACVPWTTDKGIALHWSLNGHTVVARLKTKSHSADGLQIFAPVPGTVIPDAPLYTQYVPKKDEFRVHFMNKRIIDVQRKALRPNTDPNEVNWKVRNLSGGFIFVRNDFTLPASHPVIELSEHMIKYIPLDFGAIDIIYNEKSNRAYALEVNTAPGVSGTTLETYAEAFKTYYGTKDEVTE